MGNRNRFKDAQAKREPGQFFPLPVDLIRSQSFSRLSPYAVKLLMDLIAQWNGYNNGDLCATWTLMKQRGWRSKETLNKALKELTARDFIVLTRQGGRHKASLYGFTCINIDECGGKLDVQPGPKFKGRWRRHEPLPPLLASHPAAGAASLRLASRVQVGAVPDADSRGTATVPIRSELTRRAGQG